MSWPPFHRGNIHNNRTRCIRRFQLDILLHLPHQKPTETLSARLAAHLPKMELANPELRISKTSASEGPRGAALYSRTCWTSCVAGGRERGRSHSKVSKGNTAVRKQPNSRWRAEAILALTGARTAGCDNREEASRRRGAKKSMTAE